MAARRRRQRGRPAEPAAAEERTQAASALAVARVGLVLLVVGWGLGGGLGVLHPLVGAGVGMTALLLVGGGWGATKVGLPGVGAALVASLGALGLAIEAHHAVVVTRVPIEDAPSLDAWQERGGAVRLPEPLRHDERHAGWVSRWVNSGKRSSQVHARAVPLLDARGQVVAFACGTALPLSDGPVALAAGTWTGGALPLCDEAIADAVKRCRAAKLALSAQAEERVLAVFPDEGSLRGAHHLGVAFGLPLGALGLLTLAVALRRR